MKNGMVRSAAERQGEADQRDRILEEAESLFLKEGFDGTTIDMIVSRAHISKSDFYLHFQNRDDVFLAVARRLIVLSGRFLPIPDGPLFDQLATLGPLMRRGQVMQPGIGILRAAIVANRFSSDVARQVYLRRASQGDSLARLLMKTVEADGARFDDASLCAYRFGAIVTDGLRHLAGLPMPGADDQRAFGRYAADIFLYGYAAREDGSSRAGIKEGGKHGWIAPQPVFPDLPPTRKSQESWNAVLDQAWSVFRQAGYDAASMDGISDRAGLPKNTIYRRFGSKAGLFLFTARRRIDMILAAPVELEKGALTGHEILTGVMLDMQKRFCSEDCLALSRILIAGAGEHDVMTSTVCEYLVQQVIDKILPIVLSLIRTGDLAIGVAPDLAAWHIFVLATFGSRFLFIAPESAEEQLALASEAAEQFLFGIFRPPL